MKTMKKGLGLILAIAVALTALVFPVGVVAADAAYYGNTTVAVDEDFETSTLSNLGVSLDNADKNDYVIGTVSGDTDNTSNVIQLYSKQSDGRRGVNASLPTAVNSGVVEFSMKVKANGKNYAVINAYNSSDANTELATMTGGNHWTAILNGNYDLNTWYNLNIKIDLDADTYAISLQKGTTPDYTKTGTYTNDFAKLQFAFNANDSNAETGGYNYIDDVVLTHKAKLDTGVLYEENFDGLKTGTDTYDVFSKLDNQAPAHSKIVDTGDSSHNNVYALAGGGTEVVNIVNLGTPVKSGYLTWSIMFRPNGNNYYFETIDKEQNYSSGKTAEEVLSLNASNVIAGTGDEGYKSANLTAQSWYKATVVYDFSVGKFRAKVADASGNVVLDYVKTTTLKDLGIQNFVLRGAWDATADTYFDNIKITTTADFPIVDPETLPEGYLFLEDFSEMTTISEDSRFFEDYKDNATLAIQNEALAVTRNATKAVVMNLSEPVTSGKVTWSMKVTPGNNYFALYASDVTNAWNGKYSKASIGDNSELNVANATAFKGTAGTVYTFNAMYDLDNKTVTSQWVTADGTILVESTHKDFTYSQLAAVAFQGGWTANCGVTYFDDITIREGDWLVEETVLWEEDFDEMTADTMGSLTYTDKTSVSFEAVGGATTNSIGVARAVRDDGQAEIKKTHTTVSEDCVKYTYSVYADAAGSTPIWLKGTDDKSYLLAYLNQGYIYHSATDSSAEYRIGSYETGWIYLENIVNLATKTNTLNVYDASGKLIASGVDEEFRTPDSPYSVISDIAMFNFRNWSNYTTYLDDIKIEKMVLAPALTNNSVTMTDYKGGAVTGITNPTPGVTNITLEFGTTLDSNTLDSAVTLKTSGGATVDYKGTVAGSKYIMTFSGLAPKTDYVLNIAENKVKNNNGDVMTQAFTLNFTTTEGKTAAALVSVKEGDTDAALADIATGDTLTINANYDNTLASDMSITYVIAYYKGNTLANIEVIDETETLSGAGVITQDFTAKDMTDITGVTVYMWDDLYSAHPYCVPVEL